MIASRRLARAVWLDCETLGLGRWLVSGGAESHVVENDTCECWDARAGHTCKHRLRATCLELLPPEVLAALREIVPRPATRTFLEAAARGRSA